MGWVHTAVVLGLVGASSFVASGCERGDDVPPLGSEPGDADGGLADAGPPADLHGFIEHMMAAGGVAGLSTALVTEDDTRLSAGFGYADIDAGTQVTEHTLFIVASVSKTVTAMLVMQLVEEDALDPDAPVDDYLPYPVRHPDYPDRAVTARMLLTHTAGLADDFLLLGKASFEGDPPVPLAQFSEGYVLPGGSFYGEDNWGPAPGSTYSYCNAGFGVLGHLVEVISGEDLRTRSQQRVFEPLDMTSTGWLLEDVDASRLAVPYGFNGRNHTAVPRSGFAYYPAASLRTSARDLARFLRAMARGGELDGARVLDEATMEEMVGLQVPDLRANQAIAWRTRSIGGRVYFSHSGTTSGASALLAFEPQRRTGLLMLTNSDAYLQARFGLTEGRDALDAIVERLGAELTRP